MSRVKQFAMAAALVLIASGAMASSFRVADQVYIPVAGHINASGGTFISDVVVANMSSQPVTVSVIFTPTSTFDRADKAPQYFNDMFTLQANERREFRDFISAAAPNGLGKAPGLESFGSLIFNGCLAGSATACRSGQDEFGDHPDYRDLSVTSRIYFAGPNAATLGTTAQFFPGIPWYNYVSMLAAGAPVGNLGIVTINGLSQTGGPGTGGTFRGNVGLMNASQYSRTTLRLRLYQGSNPSPIGEANVELGPLNHIQGNLTDLFQGLQSGPSATNLYVTVEQIGSTAVNAPLTCQPEGCPGFLAYGALLDNLSADPVTLEAIYLAPLYNALEAIYGQSAGKPVARRIVGRD
ncbi:MAG TPA: hypothetical protein VM779_09195 [Thermoanaerobaculia bacterium]|nr:hypothetical protein [Thermoanaerobaculia bacterium]